jgi:hypothetical protein
MEARARTHEAVGLLELNVFGTPQDPADRGMIAARRTLSNGEHGSCRIDRVDPIDARCERSRERALSTADIQDHPATGVDELDEDVERCRRIWHTVPVGARHVGVVERGGVPRTQKLGLLHAPTESLNRPSAAPKVERQPTTDRKPSSPASHSPTFTMG